MKTFFDVFHKFRPEILLVICCLVFTACGKDDGPPNDLQFVKSIPGAESYRTANGVYPVLRLSGSWRDMGRQYGELAGELLRNFHGEITTDLSERGISRSKQLEVGQDALEGYSPDLKELLAGIAETSGLGWEDTLILNSGMMSLSVAVLAGAPSGCSGVAAWGDYTPDGTLVFGRNWDIDRSALLRYMKYLATVIFNPDEGNSFANIHPLGNVYLETGMNEKGLFLELNNGEQSDPNENPEAEDTSSVLVSALVTTSSLNEMADYLASIPADLSYILQIAEDARAVSLERATFGSRVREAENLGFLAAFNSFVPPYPPVWDGKVAPPPSPAEDPRYENLLALGESPEFKGKLDATKMMELMERTMVEGGAVHDGTTVQVIAVPKYRIIWFRGYQHSDWEKVDLRPLFTR